MTHGQKNIKSVFIFETVVSHFGRQYFSVIALRTPNAALSEMFVALIRRVGTVL